LLKEVIKIFTKYIDPTTDFGFKKLFGEEESKPVLKRFLFDVLELPHPIVEITFFPTELLPGTPQERKGIFDVYCRDESGREFIVEMQKARQLHFRDRTLYYSTFPINQQAERGDWDYSLNAVYFVGILDFTFHDDDRYFRRIQLMDCETHEVFSDKLTFVYIELPKFNLTLKELKTSLEKWVYFIKHAPDFPQMPDELRDEPFPMAFHIAERANLSPEEAYYYEGSLKESRDRYAEKETARIEGREEGELKAKIEIAQAMLEQQMPLETILQITGLTEDDLQHLL
jgi:predicted transposase/invertase (TIGR01784 family)